MFLRLSETLVCPNENFSIQRWQLEEPELRYQQLLHHCSAELWRAPDCKYYIVKKREKSAARWIDGWMDVQVRGAHIVVSESVGYESTLKIDSSLLRQSLFPSRV